MRKAFCSNAKYKPCTCVHHNNKTPLLKRIKQKKNPFSFILLDLSYLDRLGIQRRIMSHKCLEYSEFHCCLPAEYIRRLRYCDYLGKYFCDCCHSYAQSPIPARILSKWDFKKYYVCNFSKHLLDSIWQHPIFNVSSINKTLYTKSKEMDRVRVSVAFLFGISGSETFRKKSLGQDVLCVYVVGRRVVFSGSSYHHFWDLPSFPIGEGCKERHFQPMPEVSLVLLSLGGVSLVVSSFSAYKELVSCSKYLHLLGFWLVESSVIFE